MCGGTEIAVAGLIMSAAGTAGSMASGAAAAGAAGDAADAQWQQQMAEAQAEQQALILQQNYYDKLGIHRTNVYDQQVQYRSELEAWQLANFARVTASAQASAQDQFSAIHEQVDQRYMQAVDTMNDAHRESQINASYVSASAAESGTVGNSIRLSQQEHYMKYNRIAEIEYANLKNTTVQAERSLKAIQLGMQNVIDQAYPSPLAPIQLPEPVPYVMANVAMPSEPSMTPYMLQGLSSMFGGLGSLGSAAMGGYTSGLYSKLGW